MSYDIFLTLITFAFVGTVTPGPNNAMLMASGANFGLRRTLPHMLGITLGFPLMIALVGLGLMQVFDAFPIVDRTLKVVSIAYLLWLAYKIATAAPKLPDVPQTGGKPLTFLQAAAFQWVNPKAWSMAAYAITRFATDADGTRSLLAVGIVVFAFFAVSFPSISLWTVLGQQMRRFLTSPVRLRSFNIIMALLLVATLVPVVFPNLLSPAS
ncbi:Threonine/homoserine/homoserine lactone efflux protein [Octadecabacter temperatus]|uniref:Cysteine/O-acetylserine efflux protein n=1 Tax=Octadecabacter temperatus TaxID=1458307 RepID=A0A0K0Y414_9RHOB|nr:LysE family translocator [Octadecabacter temperatus]AKS45641.1 Cysteine/O-acetylserine efflux protein [Octadecabacter temperatus]SIN97415.1 Threonine/homoserine/homoserine lactone efflux protein [Octadecabacter temperatus]